MLTTHPLRIGVLCSGRAPGLTHLLSADPDRGHTFEIVCAITSDEAFEDRAAVEGLGVPVVTHSIRRFYGDRGAGVYRDFDVRAAYDAATLDLLEPYAPEVVLLSGYLYLVTAPLLNAYSRRLLNLHFGDLTLRRPGGWPRFPGIRAVRDALAAGQPSTVATVHLVDAGPDHGAPIVRSWPFAAAPLVREARAWGATRMLHAYAAAHEEWMIRAAGGPLWSAAIQLVTSGAVDLDDLSSRDPGTVAPWDLDPGGTVSAPADGIPVGVAILGGRW